MRVVVAVDPSGSGDADNADNDAIGIVVAALGTDGNAYLLEDCTVKAGPETWGKVATSAYERHDADVIVGEANYGGDMVRMVVHAAKAPHAVQEGDSVPRKVVRAEPILRCTSKGRSGTSGSLPNLRTNCRRSRPWDIWAIALRTEQTQQSGRCRNCSCMC